MYSIADYWTMMADHVRRDAYADALRRTVSSSSVVLNIGTGTGVFALQACRFGARRVYAVEPDPIIEVARQLARANGCLDRIEFIRALSTDITLPEQADIIVSDLRGVLPLHEHHLLAIADARRFLAPGGTFIPQRDEIKVAVVEAPSTYEHLIAPWGERPDGIDFESARSFATSRWTKTRFHADNLLVEPKTWADLRYDDISGSDVGGELRWRVGRPGTMHGICAWFETTLIEGVGFSTGPEHEERVYGTGFFPLKEPVPVGPRDVITVSLAANLVGDTYLWRWATRVQGPEDASPRVTFSQSNFSGPSRSLGALRNARPDGMPNRSLEGDIDLAVLSAMNGTIALVDIAEELAKRYPARFADGEDALHRVQEIAARYARSVGEDRDTRAVR